jgi:ABC-type dipeptide/oligopeptide/nickel transport system permease subunit
MQKPSSIFLYLAMLYFFVMLVLGFGETIGFYSYAGLVGSDSGCQLPVCSLYRKYTFNEWKYEKYTSSDSTKKTKLVNLNIVGSNMFFLGSDASGRDIMSLCFYSSKNYLVFGGFATLLSLTIGIVLGGFAGYQLLGVGSKISEFILQSSQIIPGIGLLLLLTMWSNGNLLYLALGFGIIYSIKISQLIKDKINHFEKLKFIESSREIGLSHCNIIFVQIIWYNCRHHIFIQVVYCFIGFIITESTLAYAGIGANQTTLSSITWGRMIIDGMGGQEKTYYDAGIYFLYAAPIFALIVTIIFLAVLAMGLEKKYPNS